MNNMKEVTELSKGNLGAMMCLMEISNLKDVMTTIRRCGIKGTDIYMLWSDLCSKDVSSLSILCKNCPDEVLIDACSRQDYSGRELVSEYFIND